jgi:predicted dinucleotide-utilizing enzyme
MSKNENSNNNAFIIGGAVAIIAALLAFFTFTGPDTSTEDLAVSADDTKEKTMHVEKVIKPTEAEEIVVIGEKATDELVEKANEAAIRNQVNQAMKKSEDTDIAPTE